MSDVGPERSGLRQAKGVALDVKFNTQNLGLKVGAVAHRDPSPSASCDVRLAFQISDAFPSVHRMWTSEKRVNNEGGINS